MIKPPRSCEDGRRWQHVRKNRAPAGGPGSVEQRLRRFGSRLERTKSRFEPGYIGLGRFTVFSFFSL